MNTRSNAGQLMALANPTTYFSKTFMMFKLIKQHAFALCAGLMLLLLTVGSAKAQTQFWSDTFEDAGAPSAGTRTPSTNTGFPSVPYAYYFMRTDGTNLNLQAPFPGLGDSYTTYQNVQGSKFWAGEDTDRARTGVTDVNDKIQDITWTGINISGKSGLSFKGLFAANRNQGWQNPTFGATYDFLMVEYKIDAGAWTRIGSFNGDATATNAGYLKEDTNGDNLGDGTSLYKTFQEFGWSIPGTGTTLSLRFRVSADASATQEFAIDNFRLFEAAAAPSITTQPSNASVCASSNTSFTVAATGATSYQWQVNTGSGFTDITNTGVYTNSTAATLTITGATAGMNGYLYRCVATGSGSTTSNSATLTVNGAPSISSSPSSSTICASSNTTFSVTAANATGYQWQVNTGSGFTNITNGAPYSGATTATLTITSATAGLSGYLYRVVVSGSCSPSATSNSAALTVNSAPSISVNPINSSINSGSNTTFSVTATGATGYQWQLDNGGGFVNISNVAPYSGATTATLTITNATSGMNGFAYRVIVTGNCTPSATSASRTLTVTTVVSANYEFFEGATANAKAVTNATTGLNFTLGNKLAVQNYAGYGVQAANTPSATVGSNFYVGNDGNTGTSQVNSITSTNKALFTVKSIWVYPSSNAIGSPPTNNGSITFTGKKNGVQQFTFVKNSGFQTAVQLGTNYNGFTLVDFSSGTDNSNTLIDELEITLGGSFQYLAMDNFAFTATPGITNTAATSITSTSATLNSGVNPSASAVSAISFDYSTSSTLASGVVNVAASPSTLVSGNTSTAVSANLTSLAASTTYYYRAKATNTVGTNNNSPILSFTTSAPSGVLLSTSPTLTFGSSTGMSTMAVDGNGGSTTITDLDLQIFAGDKTTGTYTTSTTMRWANAAYFNSGNGFNGVTPGPDPGMTTTGFSALIIKSSSQAANFSLKSLQMEDWGAVGPVRIAGYNNGTLLGFVSLSLPSNGDGVTKNQAGELTPAYFNDIDEVRIYSSTVNIWVAVNNIQIGSPVASVASTVTSATYNASTGVLAVTAAGLTTGDTIDGSKFSITGNGGSYTLTTANVTASSATAFSFTLNSADRLNVNGLLNKNGTVAVDLTTFNLAAAANWNATSSSAADLTTNGITVSNVAAPTITTAFYNAATSVLTITGTDLVRAIGATNDVTVSKFTITGGTGATRTLSTTGNVEILSGTSISLTLAGADIAAVNSLLNKNGTTSSTGFTYNLAAADDWNTAITDGNIQDLTGNGITVSNALPAIESATYNASTGVLAVTAVNIVGGDTIDGSKFSITGNGGSYTLTTANVTANSSTTFFFTLNAADKLNVNGLLNKNGTVAVDATTFNLAAAANWDVTTSSTADLTGNGITVSNVVAPTITSATYNASTNTLLITGTGLVKAIGATNDVTVSKFTITGSTGATRTLSTTGNVEITSATSISLTLAGADIAAVNTLLNKNGTTSLTGVTYNLAAADDWNTVITDGNIEDLTGNGITVSNVTATGPTASAAAQTNISCFGGANGSATVLASGGTAPYTYSWSPSGGTSATASGLAVGTYTVTVTDANSLQATQSFTITQPVSAVSGTRVVFAVSCNGGTNGAINLTPTGGTGPYTFNWGGGVTTEDRTGLAAGTYSVTITDANGCTGTVSGITVTQPTAISGSSVVTNVSCNGGTNGSIDLTPSGGTPGYTYNWGGGITTQDRTGLAAGTYSVTITDANGCTATISGITVTQPTAISGTTVVTNISCFGSTNGSINLTPTGGTGPYTFNWGGGVTTEDRTGLAAGTYSVTITDANGCTGTISGITITQPTALSVTAGSQTNVAVFGGTTGAASINLPTGGTPGYTYNWTPGTPTGDGTRSVTGLYAGTWTVTVMDANGCETTQSFTITQPSALVASASAQTNISCFGGSNGSATVSASGGAGGYTYSWAPTGGTAATASGLAAGTYTVTVRDANNATATQSFTVTQPAAISLATGSQTNISCNGGTNGTASVSPSGGTAGYTYSWSPTGGTAATATGLAAGTYTVTVTDANGCQATRSFTLTQPTIISLATGSQTNISCNGGTNGTASVSPSGGTAGYTYSWSPTGGTAATATGLAAGTYTVTVTDANGCQATRNFTLTQPTAISLATGSQTNISCFGGTNGTASVSPSGGTAPYTYSWSPTGGTAATATGLAAGTYTVTVTDANGCQATRSFTLTQPLAVVSGTRVVTNIACFGSSTGAINLTPTGGTGPYTFNWGGGVTTEDRTGLAAGTYSVTITDANGCTGTVSGITVTQPASAITASISSVGVSTYNGNDGTATVSATSGTPGYTYSWAPSGGTAATATGLSAGTYTVTVTDANGCQTQKTVDVVQPTAILSVNSSTSNGTYKLGSSVSIQVNFSAAVTVVGSPILALNTSENANYVSGSGTSSLTFNYTVGAFQTNDLDYASTSALTLNLGSIKNADNINAILTLPSPGASGSLGANKNLVIDGILPTISSINRVDASPTNANTINYTVTFSENVSGVDLGDFALSTTGALTGSIANISGTGSTYTVTVNTVIGTGTLKLNLNASSTGIQDAASNGIAGGYTSGEIYSIDQTPLITASGTLSALNTVYGTPSSNTTFSVTGANIAGGISIAAPTGFEVSLSSGSGFANQITVGSSGVIASTTIYVRLKASAGVIASPYSGNLTLTSTGAVTKTIATVNSAVSAKPLTLTLNALPLISKTYDGLADATLASANYTLTGVVGSEVVTVSGTASYDTKDAGAGKIVTANAFVLAGADKDNYSLTTTSATTSGVITTKTITVTAAAKAKTYGDADPALTYTFAPALITGDAFSGSLTRAAGENIGDYAIAQGSLSLSTNYTLNYTGANLSIGKKTIAATAAAKSKTYGDADPALTYTFAPALVTGDAFTGSLARAAGENIGDYAIGQGSLALSTNYTLTYTGANLSIGKKTIAVTAAGKAKTYGDADPALTYTFAPALVTGDAFTGSLARAAGENIGDYAIGQGSLALSTNYTLNYTGANLSIGKKAIAVTAAAKTKTYGDADPALTYTFAPALITGDAFSGSLTRAAGENIGDYAIGQGTLVLSTNYNLNYTGANLSIGKKTITVTAAAKAKTYGDADPALTYTFAPALITGDSFTGALSRTVGENIGDYAIGQGSLALSANYTLDYTGANLSIGKKTIAVTAAAKAKIYGDADPALTYTFSPALITGDSFTGSLSRAAGVNIGNYAINQGTLALNTNYTLSYTGANLSIGKKIIDILAVAKSKTYGEADPAFTYTVSPALVSGDAFVGELKRAAGESAGTYAINQGTLAVTPNYQLMFAPANLVIGKKDVVVTIDSKTKTYGSPDLVLTYTSTSALSFGDSFTGSPARTAGENAGQYVINAGSLALNNNYNVQYTTGMLTISPRAITVAANAKSKTYGDADPQLSYTATGLIGSDVLGGSLTRTSGENAGSYPIIQGSLSGGVNYTISFTGNVLSIEKKPLLIKADDKVKSQGNANPTLTATYAGFIGGENSNVLTVQPTLSTTASDNSAAGTYPITASGAAAQNYTIGYQNGTLTVVSGSISDVLITSTPLYENSAVGTGFGQLRTVSDNPGALFTYSLVAGTGSTDNALFRISGNFVQVAGVLDYETRATYSIRIRSSDQNGLTFEKAFTINLIDVNEAPTLVAIADRSICTTTTDQVVNLTGITSGPEGTQTVTLSVISSNPAMFSNLTVTRGAGTLGTLNYRLAPGAQGTVTISVTANDNGGISFGGTETVVQRFVLTVNALPVASIASDKGLNIFKGETVVLTATGGTGYSWANANGIVSGQATAVLTVKPEVTTTYTVTVSNASGCSEQKNITLSVSELPTEQGVTAKATNIMSPNGDGVNDAWVVEDIQLYPNNSVRIVDRAGRLVYEKKAYDNTWDATLRGAPLAEGTYYYIIDFGDGKTIKKGFITILRKQN